MIILMPHIVQLNDYTVSQKCVKFGDLHLQQKWINLLKCAAIRMLQKIMSMFNFMCRSR